MKRFLFTWLYALLAIRYPASKRRRKKLLMSRQENSQCTEVSTKGPPLWATVRGRNVSESRSRMKRGASVNAPAGWSATRVPQAAEDRWFDKKQEQEESWKTVPLHVMPHWQIEKWLTSRNSTSSYKRLAWAQHRGPDHGSRKTALSHKSIEAEAHHGLHDPSSRLRKGGLSLTVAGTFTVCVHRQI